MPWWAWMIMGVVLLGAELLAVDAQFYLVFVGMGAIIVGLLGLTGPELPVWISWMLFAILSLTSMFTVRRQLYDRLRGGTAELVDAAIGSQVVIDAEVPPGGTCRTEYRGSVWTAVNIGPEAIPAGSKATIEAVDGMKLNVRGHEPALPGSPAPTSPESTS